jgi:hypothetical protein
MIQLREGLMVRTIGWGFKNFFRIFYQFIKNTILLLSLFKNNFAYSTKNTIGNKTVYSGYGGRATQFCTGC